MYERRNDNGELLVGDVPAAQLAREYGTPVYVTDGQRVLDRYKELHKAFNDMYPTRIHYACKANTNMALLHLLAQTDCRIDAVSDNEVRLCLGAGFSPDRILFTGGNTPMDDIEFLARSGVGMNFDSISNLKRYVQVLEREGIDPSSTDRFYSFRVNPEVGAGHHEHCCTGAKESKFGIPQDRIVEAYALAHELGIGERLRGVHCHIGSGILEPEPFLLAVDSMCATAKRIIEAGYELDVVDIGGGYGIPYKPDQKELDLAATAKLIIEKFTEQLPDMGLAIEPGRFLIADSTYVLTHVNTIKKTPVKTYIGVDAGFHTLARVAMYGSYHHIYHTTNGAEPSEEYDVAGPLCESGDLFARDRKLPPIKEDDILAIGDAGAYGMTMAMRYNSRGFPGEVLVMGTDHGWMRRPETYEDVVSRQVLPEWM